MTGFHHAAIQTRDFDKSIAFYKALGFSVKISWGGEGRRCIMLDMGDGGCLEIFESHGELPHTDISGDAGNWLHLAVKTDEIRILFAKAVSAGAKVKQPPEELVLDSHPKPTLVTAAFVYGPDGELLEFFQER